MNKGIRYSQGKYICILNAGDTYDKRFIEISEQTLANSETNCFSYSSKINNGRQMGCGNSNAPSKYKSPGILVPSEI